MKGKLISKLGWWMDCFVWRPTIRAVYGDHVGVGWYAVKTYFVWQKLFRINGAVPWLVHPSSMVINWEKIKMKRKFNPGASLGCYIQACNGIEFGENVRIGPNVGIVSANHDQHNYKSWKRADPIRIGDNVWIGMNTVVLPGVRIGDNVVIGAGSVVTKDVLSNCMAAGNPCRVIRPRSVSGEAASLLKHPRPGEGGRGTALI